MFPVPTASCARTSRLVIIVDISCEHTAVEASNYTYSRAVFSAVSATYQERIRKEMFALLEMTGWIKCRQQ